MESYNASEGGIDDAALLRTIRDGHAIKQNLMWMQAESATLVTQGDSEEPMQET